MTDLPETGAGGAVRHWALIRRQLSRAKPQFALGFTATLVFAAATVVSSYAIGWAIDAVLIPAAERGDVATASLVGVAAVLMAVGVIRGVGIGFRRYGAYLAMYQLEKRDRTEVTGRYLELPLEWFRRHPTGRLISNVGADVEAAAHIAAPLPMALGVAVMLAVAAVLLLITDPFLALVGLAVGPAIMANNLFYQRKMTVAAARAQRLRAEVAEVAHESFDAALVVKTLGRENAEVSRFGVLSDDLRNRMVDVGRLRAVFDPVMEALPTLGVLAVVGVGAWRVDQGLMTAGTLVAFAYLFRLITVPMRIFAWLLGQLPLAEAGWRRVESVLAERERTSYGVDRLTGEGGAEVEVRAVSYLHPETDLSDLGDRPAPSGAGAGAAPRPGEGEVPEEERRGVEEVSFRAAAGSTVALVGPTGSGKSTVAGLLARLYDPDAGAIRLDGAPLPELERAALAETATLVFQEPFLFDDTVRNNITLGGDYDAAQVEEAARLAAAEEFIAELPDGYETTVGERGAALSGGQRQRIALARALIRRPRLLVLDDATSAVDPAVERTILDGLSRLDTTVVIAAYRRGSIMGADQVVYMEGGRVAGRGTHDQLYADLPHYAELVDAYDDHPDHSPDGNGL